MNNFNIEFRFVTVVKTVMEEMYKNTLFWMGYSFYIFQ